MKQVKYILILSMILMLTFINAFQSSSFYNVTSNVPNNVINPNIVGTNNNGMTYSNLFNYLTNNYFNPAFNSTQLIYGFGSFTNGISPYTILWVPWYTSSTDCDVAHLQTNAQIPLPNMTANIMVTDEYSELGKLIALSTNSSNMESYYNTYIQLKSISSFGSLLDWQYEKHYYGAPVYGIIFVNDTYDTASDADVRIGLSFYYASTNVNFPSSDTSLYLTNANNIASDFVKYDLFYNCKNSGVSSNQICYWLASGKNAATSGFSSNPTSYTGYYPDAIKFMLYAYKVTSNSTYLQVSKDLIEQYLTASNYTGGTSASSFKVAPTKFTWNTAGSYPVAVSQSGNSWDGNDAPRTFQLCDSLRYASNFNVPITNSFINLSDYCTAWINTGTVNTSSTSIQYYLNGTSAVNYEGYFSDSLGGFLYTYLNTTNLQPMLDQSLSHFSYSKNTFDSTACYGVYQGSTVNRLLMSSLGLDSLTNGEQLTFNSNSNITRYLSIPQNTLLTNGFLTLSGINYSYSCYQESANNNNQVGTDGSCNLNYSGNFNQISNGNVSILYYKPINSFNSIWKVFHGGLQENISIPSDCWNYSLTNLSLKINTIRFGVGGVNTDQWCYNGTWKEIGTPLYVFNGADNNCGGNANPINDGDWTTSAEFSIGSGSVWCNNNGGYTEEAIIWSTSNYPTNPSLSIGNNIVWNYSNVYNSTITTNNLANSINQYLLTCSYLNGFCNVPFIFSSSTAGTLQYSNLIFNDNGILDLNQTFNSISYETKSETFVYNMTYDSFYYQVGNVYFNYNGTVYTPDSSSNGVYKKTIDLPLVNVDGENHTFYWTVALTNTSGTFLYNSTFNNQSVYKINLSNVCTGDTTIRAINFTAYDQDSQAPLTYNFQSYFNYYLGTGVYSKNVSINSTGIKEVDLCIRNNQNYKLFGKITTSSTYYTTTDYNLVNQQINNITTNYSFYLLTTNVTTPFIILVQGQNQLPLANYYVYVYKYFPYSSSPTLVQVSKTDQFGETIGYFEVYSVDYQFVITDPNGTVLYTSGRNKVIPTTTPYTLTFTVGTILPSPYVYYNNLSGITWTLGYNQATNKASVGYTDSNSSFNYVLYTIWQVNQSGPDKLIFNQTLSANAGVIVADLTGNESGNYQSIFYTFRNGKAYLVDELDFTIPMSTQAGNLGLIGAFFIILFFSFAFVWNEIAGIISINVAIILVNILGLVNFGILGISGIVGVSILLIVFLARA